jgi:hypothetical protein
LDCTATEAVLEVLEPPAACFRFWPKVLCRDALSLRIGGIAGSGPSAIAFSQHSVGGAAFGNVVGRSDSCFDFGFTGINLSGLHEFISDHITGVRVVMRDGVASREYFSYGFDVPRSTADLGDRFAERETRTSGPDQAALRVIYLEELLWRLPRVETGA